MNELIIQNVVIPAIAMLVFTFSVVFVSAIVTYFVARQIQPISFFQSLGYCWLLIGLSALAFAPLMKRALSSDGVWLTNDIPIQWFMYGYTYGEVAMCAVRILCIVAAVAVVSCAAKNRLAFVVGTLGCFWGLLVPYPRIYAEYHDPVAAYIAHLRDSANHVLFYGAIGAVIGCGSVIGIRVPILRAKPQFSIRTLLLLTAACGMLLGTFVWFGLPLHVVLWFI